ncbi:MAG TPA: type II toxin-antitoxin system VapC family toxin [Tepidisphaeraceae bacterium]|jgi:tRNA(fMet)-specific endonuclease VapC
MTFYLLDTNHVSAALNNNASLIARMAAMVDASFGVSLPCVGELWSMVFNSRRIAENTGDLNRQLVDFRFWEFDELAAQEFGRIKAELRRLGRPIPDVDAQTAAIARLHRLTVLTADKHFSEIHDLTVENWLI